MSETTSTNQSRSKRLALAVLGVALSVGLLLAWKYLSIEFLASQETRLRQLYSDAPGLVLVSAFLIYVVVTGLSLPGATIMTLVLGWFFGFRRTLVLVSFASTTGATLAFLLSRYFLRDAFQNRFAERLKKFNEALDREGAFYLFTLRLIPAVPFFVINVVMGLTRIRVSTFWWVSQVGMFAGTCVYVYAGTTIPSLNQIADPSLLKVTDVADWQSFSAQIRDPAKDSAAKSIRTQLTKKEVGYLDGELTDDAKLRLTKALNRMLESRELVLGKEWREPQSGSTTAKQETKQLTAINRAALVYAFPNFVRPPQPILSRQLLLAFVLLGTFPLVVKKLMNRFRPVREPAESVTSNEADA